MEEIMQEIVTLTKRLMEFKSTESRPEAKERCAEFIESYIRDMGLTPQRFEDEGVVSIAWVPENGAKVLLMSHYDVVDGPKALFEAREEDDALHGRGSLDDKYAVALSLVLLKRWKERFGKEGKDLSDLPVGMLVTGDEEIGGRHGAQVVLDKIDAEFAIALDGGNVEQIITKGKGIIKAVLTTTGKTAHGATPWEGENAIEKLVDDLAVVRHLFPQKRDDHWEATLNIGEIDGGSAFNQVPDEAWAILDIRYTEEDDIERILEEIEHRCQGTLTIEMRDPPFDGGKSEMASDLLELTSADIGRVFGATDARHLSLHGIDGVVWGANGKETFHSDDEHVEIPSIRMLFSHLDRFIERYT